MTEPVDGAASVPHSARAWPWPSRIPALIRDRTSISLIVIVPAIQIVLFGYAVNLDPKAFHSPSPADHHGPSDQLGRAIENTGYFAILAEGRARRRASGWSSGPRTGRY